MPIEPDEAPFRYTISSGVQRFLSPGRWEIQSSVRRNGLAARRSELAMQRRRSSCRSGARWRSIRVDPGVQRERIGGSEGVDRAVGEIGFRRRACGPVGWRIWTCRERSSICMLGGTGSVGRRGRIGRSGGTLPCHPRDRLDRDREHFSVRLTRFSVRRSRSLGAVGAIHADGGSDPFARSRCLTQRSLGMDASRRTEGRARRGPRRSCWRRNVIRDMS